MDQFRRVLVPKCVLPGEIARPGVKSISFRGFFPKIVRREPCLKVATAFLKFFEEPIEGKRTVVLYEKEPGFVPQPALMVKYVNPRP